MLVISLRVQRVYSTAYVKLLLLREVRRERSHVALTAECKTHPVQVQTTHVVTA